MEFNEKIKNLYENIFKKNEILENELLEMSSFFYKHAEKVKCKHSHVLYIYIISSTIADGYDFIMELLNSKYIHKPMQYTEEMLKTIFKLNAFYITSMMIRDGYYDEEKQEAVKTEYFTVFKINRNQQKKYMMLFEICKKDYQKFQMEFSKFAILNIIRSERNNRMLLALTGNFFYNSYNRFIAECSRYVFRDKISA